MDKKTTNYQKKQILKQLAVDAMGGRCEICGYNNCLTALEFHHINNLEKEFSISSKSNWEIIKKELAKCALLCANCHREVHFGLHPGYLDLDKSKYYIE